MKITQYLEFNILNKFSYICSNLQRIDDFYFERTIFCLTNFCIKYLVNSDNKNDKYLSMFVDAAYYIAKHSINNCRVIVCLNSLYSLFTTLDNTKVSKIPNILIRTIITCKTSFEKDMILEIILKFITLSDLIKEKLAKFLDYFYLQMSDKEYIY